MAAINTPPAESSGVPPRTQGAEAYLDDGYWREGRISFRVRIGVTGHRDIEHSETLGRRVREHLEEVRAQFRATDTLRVCFTVFSALAEGSDRLVVYEAFDLLGEANVELHAVLPFDADDYRKDFETPDSISEFDALLDKATACTRTPPTADRDEAYERAGRWIVDHSDVVIALWDGQQPSGRGGTAEIADYARRRKVPVLLVPATRRSQPDRTPQGVSSGTELKAGLARTRVACGRIARFNRGSLRDPPLADQVGRLQARLGAAADGSAIHWMYMNVAEWALPRLARADLLAVRYQRLYYRFGEALYALAALAVTVVAAQSETGVREIFALPEVVFMLMVLGIVGMNRRIRPHDRWIGYRSLAEAFRSAMFIHLTGKDVDKERAVGELGAVQEPWYQRAFSEAWSQRPPVQPRGSDTPDLRRFLIDAWIDDQVNYHRAVVDRFQHQRKRLERTIFALFALTFVIGILHSFGAAHGRFWPHLFVFLAIALPGFGAALTGIRDRRQYRVHEVRSERTANRLQALRRSLELTASLEDVQKLAGQVQTVIEGENLDWSGVMEFQDLEMVI